MATSEMEQLEAEVRAALYSLEEEELKRVYEELKLGDIKGKTRRQITRDINRHLDSLDMESEKDDGWATLQMIKTKFLVPATKPIQVKPISSTDTVNPSPPGQTSANTSPTMAEVTEVIAAAMNSKEFRIHGQIGQPGQGDKLSFPSLARQIEEGKRKGYPDEDIVEAVIRATSHGMALRGYMDCRRDLTLPALRKILRSHYKEKDAISSYQELASGAQGPKETPQEFIIRMMNVRQRITFASQEENSPLRYDEETILQTFIQTLQTGLEDEVRQEIHKKLDGSPIADEDLLELINQATTLAAKRREKRPAKERARIHATATQPPEVPEEIQTLTSGVAELKATVALLQEQLTRSEGNRQRWNARPKRGCRACQDQGQGESCQHCFRCGSAEHFARGCRAARPTGNGPQVTQRDGQ